MTTRKSVGGPDPDMPLPVRRFWFHNRGRTAAPRAVNPEGKGMVTRHALLFAPRDALDLDAVACNTEAHPIRRTWPAMPPVRWAAGGNR